MRTLGIVVLASLCGAAAAQDTQSAQGAPAAQGPSQDWPRSIVLPQGTLVIYSPQLEKFEGVTLSGRSAVSWEAKEKSGAPVFGVFWFDATVLVDKDVQKVDVEHLAVTKVRFPNATSEQEKRVAEVIEAEVPKWDLSPSIEEIHASIAATQRVKKSEAGIAAKPPKLVFSNEPAVLLLYDGAPAVRPIPDSKAKLERVVNTPLFVVKDPATSHFYLGSSTYWYEAADPKGPWKLVQAPTPAVKSYYDSKPPPPPPKEEGQPADPAQQQQPSATAQPQQPSTAQQQQPSTAAQQKPPAEPETPPAPPKIVVATEPTELINFDGKPAFKPLGSDGKLLYAENTDGNVLVHVPTNETFVLVSGRWFKAASLEGPWTAVRPDRLPESFQSIPPDAAVGDVRTFVSGTDEANDALADTQIPQTTAVKRDKTIEVTYDGEPKFKAIEGTKMSYATNTPFSVIAEAGTYYVCHQGVWYAGASPKGPWKVSEKRPPSIDQVPASAPVYNVKYVYVYQTTPEVVYVGYLPGYTGVYPYYGSVVYGTGYYYPPYIGPVYAYPYPATFGVHVGWSPWTGFAVGVSYGTPFFSVGVTFGGYGGRYYGPAGYRAPYYGGAGAYRAGAYQGYRAGSYQGYRAGSAQGYRAGAAQGYRAGQANNIYDRPGNASRNASQYQGSQRQSAQRASQPNNVYGSRNGDVYRQNSNGSWDRNTSNGWSSQGSGASRQGSSASSRSSAPAGLSSDAAARSRSSGGAGSYGGGSRSYGGGGGGRGYGGGGGGRGGGGRR